MKCFVICTFLVYISTWRQQAMITTRMIWRWIDYATVTNSYKHYRSFYIWRQMIIQVSMIANWRVQACMTLSECSTSVWVALWTGIHLFFVGSLIYILDQGSWNLLDWPACVLSFLNAVKREISCLFFYVHQTVFLFAFLFLQYNHLCIFY